MADHARWSTVLTAIGSHYPITRRQWWIRFALLAALLLLVRLTMMAMQDIAGTDLPAGTAYQGHGEHILIHTSADTTCRAGTRSWLVGNGSAGTTLADAGDVSCDQPVTVFADAGRVLYLMLWSWWTWLGLALSFIAVCLWRDRQTKPADAFTTTSGRRVTRGDARSKTRQSNRSHRT